MSAPEDVTTGLVLDESLTAEESAFLKSQTGIEDNDELREHILAIQAKAYKVFRSSSISLITLTAIRYIRILAYKGFVSQSARNAAPMSFDLTYDLKGSRCPDFLHTNMPLNSGESVREPFY
jgi:hypothetical protein